MFATQALDIWKPPYVPGSMRNNAKYRAPVFVVASVMMMPDIATSVGYTMYGERVLVLSLCQVLNRLKRAVNTYGFGFS